MLALKEAVAGSSVEVGQAKSVTSAPFLSTTGTEVPIAVEDKNKPD
jgi:hypothetical protein